MLIKTKSREEVEKLRKSNQLVGMTHGIIAERIKPGVKTIELDKVAEEYIRSHGAEPAFLGYNGFPYSLCISVNDQVVHGFPSDYKLREGDIVSVDCGVKLNGWYGDSAYTYTVGQVDEEKLRLLKVTKEALYKGIEQARSGNRIGDIGYAIQAHAEAHGYGVVRELVGHGIGQKLHEKPEVPNYGRRGNGPKLKDGMCIAIEPMINMGGKEVTEWDDGWTIATADGKASAHFEHTVAIWKEGAEILSTFEFIENALKERQ